MRPLPSVRGQPLSHRRWCSGALLPLAQLPRLEAQLQELRKGKGCPAVLRRTLTSAQTLAGRVVPVLVDDQSVATRLLPWDVAQLWHHHPPQPWLEGQQRKRWTKVPRTIEVCWTWPQPPTPLPLSIQKGRMAEAAAIAPAVWLVLQLLRLLKDERGQPRPRPCCWGECSSSSSSSIGLIDSRVHSAQLWGATFRQILGRPRARLLPSPTMATATATAS